MNSALPADYKLFMFCHREVKLHQSLYAVVPGVFICSKGLSCIDLS